MIKTSTLKPLKEKAKPLKEIELPEFSEPGDQLIKSILNFSKSLEILKSDLVSGLVLVKS